MGFYKKTNRMKDGRKKRDDLDYYKVEEEKSFYERTFRDKSGRKKKNRWLTLKTLILCSYLKKILSALHSFFWRILMDNS